MKRVIVFIVILVQFGVANANLNAEVAKLRGVVTDSTLLIRKERRGDSTLREMYINIPHL